MRWFKTQRGKQLIWIVESKFPKSTFPHFLQKLTLKVIITGHRWSWYEAWYARNRSYWSLDAPQAWQTELTSHVLETFLNCKNKTEAQTGLANPIELSMAVWMMKPITVGLVPIVFQLEVLLAHNSFSQIIFITEEYKKRITPDLITLISPSRLSIFPSALFYAYECRYLYGWNHTTAVFWFCFLFFPDISPFPYP